MILFGTIVNAICIFIGSFIGLLFVNIKERYKETVMKGISLTVILIGLQLALKAESIIIVLLSMLSGALIGEGLKLENKMNALGNWLEKNISKNKESNVSEGFLTATLLFVIGAMSIIGALDSGISGNHDILLTKAIIDGFAAFVLTTTLGFGVVFSIIPVVLYQGGITIFASYIIQFIPEGTLDEIILFVSAVGGLLIVGLGLNLLNITKIRVINLLPSIFTVIVIVLVMQLIK